MKSTGIVRKVDELGRCVLPIELRRTFGIKEKDALEIFVGDNNEIILKPYTPGCQFCNESSNLTELSEGKYICRSCVKKAADKINSNKGK